MYDLELRKSVEKVFRKLAKRNPGQLEIIHKRIEEIRKNPHHYKNLRRPLQHLKRVRVDKSFVLVFSIDDSEKVIVVEVYDHHDNIYRL